MSQTELLCVNVIDGIIVIEASIVANGQTVLIEVPIKTVSQAVAAYNLRKVERMPVELIRTARKRSNAWKIKPDKATTSKAPKKRGAKI